MTFEEFIEGNIRREDWNTSQLSALEKAFNIFPANPLDRQDELKWFIVSTPTLSVWLREDMPDEAIDGPFTDRENLKKAFLFWKEMLDKGNENGIMGSGGTIYD